MRANHDSFLKAAKKLDTLLTRKRPQVEALLLSYETYETVTDEIERSSATLKGLEQELAELKADASDLSITAFLPLNLPLYSLMLFAVAPSALARHIYVRAPAIAQEILAELFELLEIKHLFPNIIVKQAARGLFLQLYAGHCDVILFTGKYENALAIHKACPQALLLYNGSGINPAIVFKNADIRLAADKIFEMRTFNSGQDCAGMDAIFVHKTVMNAFLQRLKEHIRTLVSGKYGTANVQVGPIQRREYIDQLADFLNEEAPNIVHGGIINFDSSIVEPTIVVKPARDHKGAFHEFFAPIFYVLVYEDEQEIADLLTHPAASDYTMYISYFGDHPLMETFTTAKLLHNTIINDIEKGNCEYGGYGKKASFAAFGSQRIAKPILISREIDNFYYNGGLLP